MRRKSKPKRSPYRYPDIDDLLEERRRERANGCVYIFSLLGLVILVALFIVITGGM